VTYTEKFTMSTCPTPRLEMVAPANPITTCHTWTEGNESTVSERGLGMEFLFRGRDVVKGSEG
jgi:hypothetical protein